MSRDSSSAYDRGAAPADRGTLVAFVLMVLFAGGNAVAVRLSNSALPPFWGAAMRSAAAALVFWVIVVLRQIALPRGRALVGAVLYGLIAVGAAYAFLYWGLLRVPASLGSPILALVPLMTLFFAWAHGLEELRWRGVVGALIAIAGVLIGVVGGLGSAVHAPSFLALVAGTACFAEAAVVFKLFPQSHPLVTNAVAFTTGTPLLVVVSRLAGEPWSLPNTGSTWAAFAYLVLIGSVVVFYLYLHVLSRWTASATSYSFLLMPVTTVVMAAWLLGEVVTISFVIGAALALAGVWMGAIQSSPKVAELTCSPTASKAIC
jgi:drug/metabolite transporter (DMT)-like permease